MLQRALYNYVFCTIKPQIIILNRYASRILQIYKLSNNGESTTQNLLEDRMWRCSHDTEVRDEADSLANIEVNPKLQFRNVRPKIRSLNLTGLNLAWWLVQKFISRQVAVDDTTVFCYLSIGRCERARASRWGRGEWPVAVRPFLSSKRRPPVQNK
jgi:hypothetical protein